MPVLSFELALELKDAGFPQLADSPTFHYDTDGALQVVYPEVGLARPVHARAPNLTELVDACGSRISTLRRSGSGWCADAEYGDTADEAVARLWIALSHG